MPGWPGRLQTLGVDRQGNVWISGTTPGDSIVKFSSDGKLLWDFGHRGPKVPANQVKQNNQQTDIFPPGIGAFDFDEDAHEIYITDGFLNKRVLVYDMDTGVIQTRLGRTRHSASARSTTIPLRLTTLRVRLRIRSNLPRRCTASTFRMTAWFTSASAAATASRCSPSKGSFVTSFFVHPSTQSRGPNCGGIWGTTDPPCGTIYNMAFSHGPAQKYLFVADGTNNMVWILNRKDGTVAGSFGGNGRYAGQLHWIDAVAVDSKGNVYTGEVEDGKRIQKFVLTH